MAQESKAGIAGGVLVALGVGGGRFIDDCARAGSRGARALDDVTVAGPRMASWGPAVGLDDAARLGAGGLDEAAALGMRGARRLEGPAGAHVDELPWLAEAREGGLDIGVELLDLELPDAPAVELRATELRCPTVLRITREPEAWTKLRGGFGVACGPIVLLGTAGADGASLKVGGREQPIEALLGACAEVGARCVVVGCDQAHAEACEAHSEESRPRVGGHRAMSTYVRAYVDQLLVQEHPPAVVAQLAVEGGSTHLVVARPAPRNSDGSPQVLPPGPPSRPPHTLVLAYHDFGPQALAGTLLGSEWWQWEAGGSWEPGDRFDVRVVVYRGLSEDEVRAEYPTIEGEADHRYVGYDQAMAFLDGALDEVHDAPELRGLVRQLEATRARIRAELAPESAPAELPVDREP